MARSHGGWASGGRAGLAVLLVLVAGLAGCGSPTPGGGGPGLPALSWPVLNVETTHDEPEPQRGDLLLAWGDGAFAISAPGESDLAGRSLRVGGDLYTTNQDLGWVRRDLGQAVAAGAVSSRLYLWDLRGLVEADGLQRDVATAGDTTNVSGSGTVRIGTYELPVKYQVTARAGQVVSGLVSSERGRESPYTFRAAGYPFPFELAAPASSRSPEEVVTLDAQASQGHDLILRLVQDYQRNRGSLPDAVDPQTLGLELLASGESWPTNPYGGQPMADGRASGGFTWHRCSPQDGRFTGYGYDGPLVGRLFGRSCV